MARFSTFDSDVPAGTDLDIYVYQAGTANLVALSAGATAQEQVQLVHPAAGSYDVYVDLFALASGVTSQPVKGFSWVLAAASAGNMTVTPASQPATTGTPATVTVNWTGLTSRDPLPGQRRVRQRTSTVGRTVIRVDG